MCWKVIESESRENFFFIVQKSTMYKKLKILFCAKFTFVQSPLD